MQEVWKEIPNTGRMYYVSNFGHLVSYNSSHHIKANKPRHINGHNLRGYIQVNLSGKMYLLHRLVAEAFIPNPNNKPFINHKDGVKNNNHADNLEWVTQSENMRHSYDVLKQPLPPGNPKPIRCVETGKTYKSAADAQRDTGVSKANIGKVALAKGTGGRRLGHTNLTAGGYHWEFVN